MQRPPRRDLLTFSFGEQSNGPATSPTVDAAPEVTPRENGDVKRPPVALPSTSSVRMMADIVKSLASIGVTGDDST